MSAELNDNHTASRQNPPEEVLAAEAVLDGLGDDILGFLVKKGEERREIGRVLLSERTRPCYDCGGSSTVTREYCGCCDHE